MSIGLTREVRKDKAREERRRDKKRKRKGERVFPKPELVLSPLVVAVGTTTAEQSRRNESQSERKAMMEGKRGTGGRRRKSELTRK